MTTYQHTPLSGTENLDHTTLNAIFDELDGAGVRARVTGTAGELLAERDVVYLDPSTNTWKKVDVDANGPVACGRWLGMVVESGGIASASTGTIQLRGMVTGFSGLTAGGLLYAATFPGSYTPTRPSVTDGGAQRAIVVLGVALSTSEMYFAPQRAIFAKRATLADNATLTIEHYADGQTRRRDAIVYVDDTNDEALKVGSVTGDAMEVGVRFDDGSGSDGDTKTTFKNLTGSSADVVCLVVMD